MRRNLIRNALATFAIGHILLLLMSRVDGLAGLALTYPSATWGAVSHAEAGMPAQHMTDGLQAFERGDFEAAVTHWRQAVQGYAAAQQVQAESVALTHLAQAYQALGHSDLATERLQAALKLAESARAHLQVALILNRLAELTLAAGNRDEAARLVQDALTRAHKLDDDGLTATILHTRGNLFMVDEQWHDALAAYRDSAQAAQQAGQWGVVARALIHASLAAERDAQPHAARTLLDDARPYLRQAGPSHDTAYDLIQFGRAYHRLAPAAPELTLQADAVLQQAADLAQALLDQRALSYAWGYRGRLYEEAQRHEEALVSVQPVKTGITPPLAIPSHEQAGEKGVLHLAGRLHERP